MTYSESLVDSAHKDNHSLSLEFKPSPKNMVDTFLNYSQFGRIDSIGVPSYFLCFMPDKKKLAIGRGSLGDGFTGGLTNGLLKSEAYGLTAMATVIDFSNPEAPTEQIKVASADLSTDKTPHTKARLIMILAELGASIAGHLNEIPLEPQIADVIKLKEIEFTNGTATKFKDNSFQLHSYERPLTNYQLPLSFSLIKELHEQAWQDNYNYVTAIYKSPAVEKPSQLEKIPCYAETRLDAETHPHTNYIKDGFGDIAYFAHKNTNSIFSEFVEDLFLQPKDTVDTEIVFYKLLGKLQGMCPK